VAVVSRQRWYIASAVVAEIVVVAVVLVVWRPWRENRSASAPLGSPAPPEVTSMILSSVSTPPTPSASTTTVAPVALPSEPPPNAGCDGVVISHSDLEHPTLGLAPYCPIAPPQLEKMVARRWVNRDSSNYSAAN
jgi:hypothetical protein